MSRSQARVLATSAQPAQRSTTGSPYQVAATEAPSSRSASKLAAKASFSRSKRGSQKPWISMVISAPALPSSQASNHVAQRTPEALETRMLEQVSAQVEIVYGIAEADPALLVGAEQVAARPAPVEGSRRWRGKAITVQAETQAHAELAEKGVER